MNALVEPRCLNCAAAMSGGQNYCAACGQRVIKGRLTLHHVGHDLLHAITHADHSIFALVKDLALSPGGVAREYIEGRRKKYFGPFAFLFISVALASFMILVLGVQWFSPIPDTGLAGSLQRHVNLVILFQAPVLSGLCALFFLSQRFNFAEHLVLAAYTSGFRCLLLALIWTPLMFLTRDSSLDGMVLASYYLVWFGYFAFAAVKFYGGRIWWTACKAAGAAILTQLIAMSAILGLITLWRHFAH